MLLRTVKTDKVFSSSIKFLTKQKISSCKSLLVSSFESSLSEKPTKVCFHQKGVLCSSRVQKRSFANCFLERSSISGFSFDCHFTKRSALNISNNNKFSNRQVVFYSSVTDKRENDQETEVSSNVDEAEISMFSSLASEWWNVNGQMGPLIRMNPVRMEYIREEILRHFKFSEERFNMLRPLQGLNILDVGCGGGIATESLARLGAQVTGIDASKENVEIAKIHAKSDPVVSRSVKYMNITSDFLLANLKSSNPGKSGYFDAVVSLEVIEHVPHPMEFISSLTHLLKDGGILFLSTINRTPLSYFTAIFLAEKILQWVPEGVHDWQKFLSPNEIDNMFKKISESNPEFDINLQGTKGMCYNPLKNNWNLGNDTNINYICHATKNSK